MPPKPKVLNKDEQNQRATAGFLEEPKERAKGRQALLGAFKDAFNHFDAQGIAGAGRHASDARNAEDREKANAFKLTLNELLPPKQVAEVVEDWSRNEFQRWEARDRENIKRALAGDGRDVDTYMAANRPDLTEASGVVSRVVFTDNNFSVEGQPERMKAMRELSINFDRLSPDKKKLVDDAITKLGLDPEAVRDSMAPSHRFSDGVARLKVNANIIASERHQFQGVDLDANGRERPFTDWGRQIDKAATEEEIIAYAAKLQRNGDFPRVMNNEFLNGYRERYGAAEELIQPPTVHEVLTASAGQFSPDELALVRREASNAVKAEKAGLVQHAGEQISFAAVNQMAARTLGQEGVLDKYRAQRQGPEDPSPEVSPERKVSGQIRIDRHGNSDVKNRNSLTVDFGGLPDMTHPVIVERTRRKVREPDGGPARNVVVAVPPEMANDVKASRAHKARITTQRRRRREGHGGRGED